eukprot:m.101270 g.101270  ORF g.101270 m.101270 type:complete len:63 (+) comp27318_c3_seq1:343-531(+)
MSHKYLVLLQLRYVCAPQCFIKQSLPSQYDSSFTSHHIRLHIHIISSTYIPTHKHNSSASCA